MHLLRKPLPACGTSPLMSRHMQLLLQAVGELPYQPRQEPPPSQAPSVLLHLSPTMHPLRLLRRKHNLTQQMLADLTALSKSTIERAERNEPLSIYSCQQLCDYFGKTPEQLGLLPQS